MYLTRVDLYTSNTYRNMIGNRFSGLEGKEKIKRRPSIPALGTLKKKKKKKVTNVRSRLNFF